MSKPIIVPSYIALFLLVISPHFCIGRITSAEIRKDDRLLIPLDEPFGFGSDGKLNITISNFMLRPIYDPQKKAVTKPNLHRMGILITTPYGGMLLDQQVASEGHCPLDSDEQITLLTFDQVDLTSRFLETDVLLSSLLEEFTGGEFMLYFANCEADTAVDFDMILDLYNQKGDKIDYLPVGEDALPLLYFVVFLCFSVLAGAWLVVIVRARRHVQKVHYLMAALVAFKSLTVLSQSGMYHMIALHGHPEGWNVAYVGVYYISCPQQHLSDTSSLPNTTFFFAVLLHGNAQHSILRPHHPYSSRMELHETLLSRQRKTDTHDRGTSSSLC